MTEPIPSKQKLKHRQPTTQAKGQGAKASQQPSMGARLTSLVGSILRVIALPITMLWGKKATNKTAPNKKTTTITNVKPDKLVKTKIESLLVEHYQKNPHAQKMETSELKELVHTLVSLLDPKRAKKLLNNLTSSDITANEKKFFKDVLLTSLKDSDLFQLSAHAIISSPDTLSMFALSIMHTGCTYSPEQAQALKGYFRLA